MPISDLKASLELLAQDVILSLDVSMAAFSLPAETTRFMSKAELTKAIRVPANCATCLATRDARAVLALEDMDQNPKYVDNPFVANEPHIRAYLGAPVFGRKNEVLGTVCAYDSRRKKFSSEDQIRIEEFAVRASAVIELINLSEGIKNVSDYKSLLGAIDGFALLGYEEIANYLVAAIYKQSPRESFRNVM